MHNKDFPVYGAGLGLRRAFIRSLSEYATNQVSFWEIAPENWIGVGGYFGKKLRALTEQHPFICHGLSLSIGGPTPIDQAFTKIKIPTSTQYPLLQRTFELLQR